MRLQESHFHALNMPNNNATKARYHWPVKNHITLLQKCAAVISY